MSERVDVLRWLLAAETWDEDRPRVHVALPTYGNTPAVCLLSFGIFMANGAAAGFIQHAGEIEGAYIDRARNDLIRQAIANDSTHLMFVDQDMILPESLVKLLLAGLQRKAVLLRLHRFVVVLLHRFWLLQERAVHAEVEWHDVLSWSGSRCWRSRHCCPHHHSSAVSTARYTGSTR